MENKSKTAQTLPKLPVKRKLDKGGVNPTRKLPRFWTEEDDAYLRASVKKNGEQYWTQVAKEVPGRNAKECVQRWKKVLAPGLKKGKWSDEEDSKLLKLIKEHGQNWTYLSECMKSRSSKQCRERWMNHLNPDLKKTKWTEEEDAKLMELAALYPRKWAEMARGIAGRTENMAKCRYHTLIRRQAKMERKQKGKTKEAKSNKRSDTLPKNHSNRATKTPKTAEELQQTNKATPNAAPSMMSNQVMDMQNFIGKHLLNSAPPPQMKPIMLPTYASNMATLGALQYPALLKAAASIGYSQQTPPAWYLDFQKTIAQQPNLANNGL